MTYHLLQDFPVWGSGCGWGNGWKGGVIPNGDGESTMGANCFEAAHPSLFGYMIFRSGYGEGDGRLEYTGECAGDNYYG